MCFKCKKKFNVVEREFKHPEKEKYYCSRSCANRRDISPKIKSKIKESLLKHPKNLNRSETRKCLNCEKEFKTSLSHNKKHCSVSCARKYKFKDCDKNKLSYYRQLCCFCFNLKKYPNEFDFKLVSKHGWYKAKNKGNNLTGVSRDHIISVKYGFDNNIDPSIISHPANCQLLLHGQNASKGVKSDLTIDELKQKIEVWNKKYGVDAY